LPDAEFEVMKAVWNIGGKVNCNMVMNSLSGDNCWKPQTVLTLLGRLTQKGFLRTEKHGWERYYSPLISRDEYMKFEVETFAEKFERQSLVGLARAFYDGKKISQKDLDDLLSWIKEKRE